jgi:PIN domain nuclease of toxin-antitoxin system
VLADPANRLFLSAASAWEIAVKHALGRLPLPGAPDEIVPRLRAQHRIEPLAIDEADALHVAKLPLLHRDPFDRMLVAQAICRNLVIATPDPLVRAYPCKSTWPT